jgi:sporulation protein YlmC with PRC-barrel domain
MTISMQIDDWRGRKVVDPDGHKIGKIEDVYYDEADGRPEWALVRTGLFGTRDTFVPLDRARLVDRDIVVPYDKELVKEAPGVDGDDTLSIAEEAQLAAYYRRDFAFEGGHLSYSGGRMSRADTSGDDVTSDDARADVTPAPPPAPPSDATASDAERGGGRRMPSELTRTRWVSVAMPADEAERLGYTPQDEVQG